MKDKILKNKYIFIVLLLIIIAIIAIILISNEKTQIPFEVKQVYLTSTANGEYTDANDTEDWNLNLFQNNDVYIKFGLVQNMEKVDKKDAEIKQIYVENFNIVQKPVLGEISYYKLSEKENKLFEYTDNYLIGDKLELTVVEKNAQIKKNQVNKNEGQIALSIVNKDIIENEFEDIKELVFDGTLLDTAKVNLEDIKFKVSFDIVIVTKKNRMYKANLSLDLPTGNILENGFELNENIDISQTKFEIVK